MKPARHDEVDVRSRRGAASSARSKLVAGRKGPVVDDGRLRSRGVAHSGEAAGIGPVEIDQGDLGRKSAARAASISATMLEPRPEIRMATRAQRHRRFRRRSSGRARLRRCDDLPDADGVSPASRSARHDRSASPTRRRRPCRCRN